MVLRTSLRCCCLLTVSCVGQVSQPDTRCAEKPQSGARPPSEAIIPSEIRGGIPSDENKPGVPKSAWSPLEIRHECIAIRPGSLASDSNDGRVYVRAVLEGYMVAAGGKRPVAELLSLSCEWHGQYGGCGAQGAANECPTERFGDMLYRPNSWSCNVMFQELSSVRHGFSIHTEKSVLGYPPAENWYGKPQIEMFRGKFAIDLVSAVNFPGKLTVSCPTDIGQALLPVGRRSSETGCSISLENPYVQSSMSASCDTTFVVPGVSVLREE